MRTKGYYWVQYYGYTKPKISYWNGDAFESFNSDYPHGSIEKIGKRVDPVTSNLTIKQLKYMMRQLPPARPNNSPWTVRVPTDAYGDDWFDVQAPVSARDAVQFTVVFECRRNYNASPPSYYWEIAEN